MAHLTLLDFYHVSISLESWDNGRHRQLITHYEAPLWRQRVGSIIPSLLPASEVKIQVNCFEPILLKALANQAADRFASAGELVAALHQAMFNLESTRI